MKTAAMVWGVCLVGLLLYTAAAHAHADLLTAVPAPGSHITYPLSEIRLTFSEPITPNSTILLFSESFEPVANLTAQVTESDPHTLSAAIPSLRPGNYTVQWTAVSTDGHTTSGSYTFGLASSSLASSLLWQVAVTLVFISLFVIFWRRTHQGAHNRRKI
jgi:methionine-rich copper-binding protein CopC